MTRASALLVLLRRSRSEFAAVVLVALLVCFTAFVFATAIRLLERAGDDGLRRAVAAAPVVQRTVLLTTARPVLAHEAAPSMTEWHAEGDGLRTMFPEAIDNVLADGSLAIGSVRLGVANPPDYPMFVTLHHVDRFTELAELAEGRWPTSTNEQLPAVVEFPNRDGDQLGFPVSTPHFSGEPRRFEIAVQESTARALGLSVGYRLAVSVDLLDTMLSNSIIRTADVILAPTELEITGLYRIPDPDADVWFDDPRLLIDDLGYTGLNPDLIIAYIGAYVPAEALPGLVSSSLPFEYQWRFPILVDRLDADAVAQAKDALRLLESRFGGANPSGGFTAQAGLLPLLDRHTGLRSASEAVIGLAASAPLALAGGAIGMAAVLLARRRRPAIVLARGRGASGRLLLTASLLEAVAVAALATLAGLGLAIVLVPGAEFLPSLAVALAIAALGIAVLVGAALPPIRQPLADLDRTARPVRRFEPRRLVAETTVVTLALVGAYVLRQRGVTSSAIGLDPFLAAVPPLIGIAAGIATIRLYPPTIALAGWLADRRRDLVPALGVRAVARGSTSSLPALVMVLAVAFAAFTGIVSVSVDDAQRTASWVSAGADVRIEPGENQSAIPPTADFSAIAGVEGIARGYVDRQARAPAGTRAGTIAVHAVETDAYADVVAGSPIDPRWPPPFLEEPGDPPVPAIVGTRLAGEELGLKRGDTFELTLFGRRIQMQVADVRPGVAGLTSGDSFVVVPYAWFEQAASTTLRPSMLWMRAPADVLPALRAHPAAEAGGVTITSRYDAYAALRDQPVVGAVGAAFALAFAVSVAYAVLTILGSVMLSAARRTRDLAILRTLGLSRREATRLTLLEHAPPLLIALPLGIALGIGVAVAVAPALNLGALSGSSGEIPLIVDWPALAVVSLGLALLAVAAVVLGAWLARREAITNALRMASD